MQPKVFISYSWSSPQHQSLVREWAEQLIADGIEVVLDIYDLKEGHDKFVFMERMVTDSSVTHVLVVCDKIYSEKADARKAGVGTESQIISQEVYEKVEQSKFIPIACEFDDEGNPFLPTFLKSRVWINFSSPEEVNNNWEKLVRVIYGKPLYEKPKVGQPPVYITDDTSTPSSPAITKFNAFRQALLQDKKGLSVYRKGFLSACIDYADALRIRERPNVDSIEKKVLEDSGKLVVVRNHIIDWVLLESEVAPSNEFCDALLSFLEELRELKSRPAEISSWNEAWFEAHKTLAYETFLYIVAALLKTRAYHTLHEVFTSQYINPSSERYHDNKFSTFQCFYHSSDLLQQELAPEGRRLLAPTAELIRRQADRTDLQFSAIIEAELLVLLMALINPSVWWYPQCLHYASYKTEFPFFIRATQHKHFLSLATITEISDANQLREAVKKGQERLGVSQWHPFVFTESIWSLMNMDNLDSIK